MAATIADSTMMADTEATMADTMAVAPVKAAGKRVHSMMPFGSFFARVSAMVTSPRASNKKRGRSPPKEKGKKKENKCGCDSKKKKEPMYLCADNSLLSKEVRQRLLDEYKERLIRSEGFDVPDLPFAFSDPIWPAVDVGGNPRVLEMAQFAVDEYNRRVEVEQNPEGKKMEFIRVIKAMVEIDCGLRHAITLEVRFSGEDEPKIYEAKTYRRANKELNFIREARSY